MQEIQFAQANAIEKLKQERQEDKKTLFAMSNTIELLKRRNPRQNGCFDVFLYLEQLFQNGTAKTGDKLLNQELLYPSTNNPKFRKPLKKFRDFLEEEKVIGRERNATFARVDYEEAYRVVDEKQKRDKS